MNSRLYVGHVSHDRKIPKRNSFRYRVYFVYLDLAELDEIDRSLKLFGHNRGGLVKLRDRDHGPRDGSPLRPWMDALLADAGIDLAGGRVCLLTFPRVLGFGFYPVSFWYCFHADGTIRAILAEVHNTFGERHNYLLTDGGGPMDLRAFHPEKVKIFHVSPFIEMDARYEFRFSEPGETLSAAIYDYVKGPLLIIAAVSLHAQELTDANLLKTVARYGPMSLRAWLLIHYQALRIVAKRIRYVPKPPPPDKETT
jgi:hypothetical protein